MAKTYVTFGQAHVHRINGKTYDADCVAVIECEDAADGRKKAFEYFGDKFCLEYPEKHFDFSSMVYFPRGLLHVNGQMI